MPLKLNSNALGSTYNTSSSGPTSSNAPAASSQTTARGLQTADSFELTPAPFSGGYAAPSTPYGQWPMRDVISDEPLPLQVLAKASENRFQNFQEEAFQKFQVPAESVPDKAKEALGSAGTFYRIRVAGTPVYAGVSSGAKASTVVLADRDGNRLASGSFSRSAHGALGVPTWQTTV